MSGFKWSLAGVGGVLIIIMIGLFIAGPGYWLHNVKADEVGIKFDQNQAVEVVPPGIYSDWNLFTNAFRNKRIENVNVRAIPFQASDPEVLTKDRQRIGVVVSGTVTRPGATNPEVLRALWGSYKTFYVDDKALAEEGKGLMQHLTGQAMKVCVGERNFDAAIIGEARDALRECIEKELDKLAGGYGLNTANIVIPDVPLAKEVQAQLDAITKARLDTQIAQQAQLQAVAEADRNAAREQGAIRTEQAKVQEKAKQDAITASLERSALEAKRESIEAGKNNELFVASRDKEIADVQRQAATLQAEAAIAGELAKARMLQQNGNYSELLEAQAMAGAYKNTDKVIVLPANANPIVTLGDSGKVIVNGAP